LLLNNISSREAAAKIAGSVLGMFNEPVILNGQEIFVTASAGVALYPKDGEDVETLIKNADIAMYRAKSRGKNQYLLCSENMKDEVVEEIKLTNLLYRAQERNQLTLFYQPQIQLGTNKIVGLEALLRWKLPDLGMVPPLRFIPLAERTGLINPIGEWVIRTACQQNKMWQDMGLGKLRMAVNLSVNQLRNSRLVSQIEGILKETGLPAEFLELEITESVASSQTDHLIRVLSNLKELGVSISIDDFGTQYSSLSRLKMLPIDRIKMEMQFVHGIEGSEKDKAISLVIINLAKSLGVKVLAEGVETVSQLDFLNQKMCDEVQGFYFYKPMPAEEIEKILRAGK
jgi:EAL domain-containing protein (putative c-di-GMP-specific phosphodiesterase class I)